MSHTENHQKSTIGAAALVLHESKVLLVQMGYGRNHGQWILPGGMVDADEMPHQAARREVLEETGLDVEITRLFAVRHRVHRDQDCNSYWIFESILKTPPAEIAAKLNWEKGELLDVRFWSFAEAQTSKAVRPLTQLFIRLSQDPNAKKKAPLFFAPSESTENDFVYL